MSSIEVDHLDGMRQMLDHLRGLGHARIGMFAGLPGTQRGVERLGAFLGHADGPVVDVLARGGWTRFRRLARAGVTGWVAGSVPAFAAALEHLDRLGLRAPADVSLCGFAGEPPLGRAPTAIFGPYAAIGHEAARIALDRRVSDPGLRVLVRCSLVAGWSTGPAPRPRRRRA
jgi:LacI family transcriptional regulator